MESDFYTDRRGLAGYFEKEWFDHVVAQGNLPPTLFEFPPFEPLRLYCDSHEKVADFLAHTLKGMGAAPTRLLEVGSALGRGLYEIYQRTPSLRSATLVEPSQNLAHAFESLFKSDGVRSYPVLWGNAEMVDVIFDSSHIREAVGNLAISLINAPHGQLTEDLGRFDLVVCFNVVDNCHDPLALVERLQRHTAPGGTIALSCTYQWSKKHLGTTETPTRNICELFDEGWTDRHRHRVDGGQP
jgi:SAM-dependent methyltransferase